MASTKRLQGKRAVVTGGSGGIGRAIALAFADAGANVLIGYRSDKSGAQACVAAMSRTGGRHHALQVDVSDVGQVRAFVNEAWEFLQAVDIWANIAGADILTGGGAQLSDDEKLERLLSVDVRGTVTCSWAAAERMSEAGGGVILNMSWDLALHGMPGRNPEMFAAAKAGISGFSKCLARSYAPRVRVNDLAPGWIETAFARDVMSGDAYQKVVDETPMRRFGTPEDVAMAAVYLASEEAQFITGQTLKVNGGCV